MKRQNIKSKKVISITFLLILSLSSILVLFPSNYTNLRDFNQRSDEDKEVNRFHPLLNAPIGEEPWWNASYQWRQCISITNPGAYNLTDNFISIQFDYATLRDTYNMDSDLYDVRIVENNVVRNYYIKKDFPFADQATIWFETNSTAGKSEYDTYMYWGNASINNRGSTHVSYDPSGTCWWSFEESTGVQGSTVEDSLGNADGHLYGSGGNYPVYDTDSAVGSYSLEFVGNNDFVYINDSLHFTEPNEISEVTVSLWYKTSANIGDWTQNWAFFDFDRSEYFNFFIRPDDGRLGFCSAASGYSGQNDFYSSTTGLNDGEWHFACVVYDGSDKIIYIDDGAEDARWVNAMGGRAFGTGTDRWGFFGDGSEATSVNGGRNNRYYEGNMDEIRYFEYAVAPDEIQWLANYYSIDTDLLPVTERAAAVTVLVKDIDDRLVPGAEVSLWENSTHILEVDGVPYTEYTSSEGTVSFTKVPFGFYNISVNYTLISGLYEEVVYDSRYQPLGEVEFKGLIVDVNVSVDLWTIDFKVDDWDGDPFDYGFVKVGNSTDYVLETLYLDSDGKTTFRWTDQASYNYTVYYDNADYFDYPTRLNSSSIIYTGPAIYLEYVKTSMSKLNIRVIDDTETVPVEGITVRVENSTSDEHIVDLKTDDNGTAYGLVNSELKFWYKRETTYNFSLWMVTEQRTFRVNYSDQAFNPVTILDYYEYTLDSASSLVFELDLNYQNRISRFQNGSLVADYSVVYSQNMSFSITLETTVTGLPGPWTNDDGVGTQISCIIKSTAAGNPIIYVKDMRYTMNGIFTIEINSSRFSAGDYGKSYIVTLSGIKSYYSSPEDVLFLISIDSMSTGMSFHDYASMPDELPTNEVNQFYDELINVTVKYYDFNNNNPLVADTFTYNWDYGSGTVNPDPINPGYYTIEIDTSAATNVGKYLIKFTAGRENYTKIDNYGLFINILSRPTTINGEDGILYISQNIFIFKELNFTFNYLDEMRGTPISNLDEMSYLLQKLDENGEPISGTTEMGSLVEGIDEFILDLDTETREDGEYSIIVTLDKMNWDHSIAIISLTIMKRVIEFSWVSDIVDSKLNLDSGEIFDFVLTLSDPNNETVPNAPIIGATITLTVRNINYSTTNGWIIDNRDGTYRVVSLPIAEPFFIPETFIATLSIEKQYFSATTDRITVVVQMQEIFGFPLFYFLMIVGATVAIVGSLVAYRTIQRARIPTFVKKAREMKKNIKGKKSISDSLLYPTKDEYITKKLGDKWESIGLSLDDIMGVKSKKSKKLPEMKEEYKGGVD
ncbi:MAG: LamG-like jellyroll fold domain-containing protein [Candidatus Hermodarchaeota archaeon]